MAHNGRPPRAGTTQFLIAAQNTMGVEDIIRAGSKAHGAITTEESRGGLSNGARRESRRSIVRRVVAAHRQPPKAAFEIPNLVRSPSAIRPSASVRSRRAPTLSVRVIG